MSIQHALSTEIDRETQHSIRMLEVIPANQLDYRPHPKSMSLGELANHIVELHNWAAMTFTQTQFDLNTEYKPLTLASPEDMVKELNAGRERSMELAKNLSEEAYMSTFTLKAGDYVIASLPKAGAYRFLVTNHLIHHRGQLSVYLRMLDVPLPGIYGPSADEQGK